MVPHLFLLPSFVEMLQQFPHEGAYSSECNCPFVFRVCCPGVLLPPLRRRRLVLKIGSSSLPKRKRRIVLKLPPRCGPCSHSYAMFNSFAQETNYIDLNRFCPQFRAVFSDSAQPRAVFPNSLQLRAAIPYSPSAVFVAVLL